MAKDGKARAEDFYPSASKTETGDRDNDEDKDDVYNDDEDKDDVNNDDDDAIANWCVSRG